MIFAVEHQTVYPGGPVKLSMFFFINISVRYDRRSRSVVIYKVSSEAVFITFSHVFPFCALCNMIGIGNMDFYLNTMYIYTKIK